MPTKHQIDIFDNKEALSETAAHLLLTIAEKAVATNGRFLIALSGGSTPQTLFQKLTQPPYNTQLPWSQTFLFWGDERLVPPSDSGSNYGQAKKILLDHLPTPPHHIHRVRGEVAAATAVADYTAQLKQVAPQDKQWPQFDLALMGMGSDGHTASLFPGPIPPAEAQNPVIAVTADYDGRPAQRITLTPLVFNDAHHLLFLVTGANKAKALTAVLHGPHNPKTWPAQRINPTHGTITWLVDQAAASQLKS